MTETPREELERLNRRARQYLVHSFLYYRLGESLLSDEAFDRIAEDLQALHSAHPEARHPYAQIFEPSLGPEASGFQIRSYPPEIVTAAFKLLYAVSNPELDFREFVERRGYSAQLLNG